MEALYNQLVQGSKTDLSKISSKNSLKGLVKPMYKFAKLVIKTNNKVQEPKTYDQAINNLVYKNS